MMLTSLTSLCCRVCESSYPTFATGLCPRCAGPLDPVYDWSAAELGTLWQILTGPRSLWRYQSLLPVAAPRNAGTVGWTPLVPAPRLAEQIGVGELLLKLEGPNPTFSVMDRVAALAAAKAVESGATVLACASTGYLGAAVAAQATACGLRAVVLCSEHAVENARAAAAARGADIIDVAGGHAQCLRLAERLARELDWAFADVSLRPYAAEGAKTVAFEIAEQLDWQLPDAVVAPVGSGTLLSKLWQGFEQLRRVDLVTAASPRLFGGQQVGCAPVASAFAEGRRVQRLRSVRGASVALAVGAPVEGDLAVATASASGGGIYAVAEQEIRRQVAALAARADISADAAGGVTLAALRAAVVRGELGCGDRVVAVISAAPIVAPQPFPVRERAVIDPSANTRDVLGRLDGLAA